MTDSILGVPFSRAERAGSYDFAYYEKPGVTITHCEQYGFHALVVDWDGGNVGCGSGRCPSRDEALSALRRNLQIWFKERVYDGRV